MRTFLSFVLFTAVVLHAPLFADEPHTGESVRANDLIEPSNHRVALFLYLIEPGAHLDHERCEVYENRMGLSGQVYKTVWIDAHDQDHMAEELALRIKPEDQIARLYIGDVHSLDRSYTFRLRQVVDNLKVIYKTITNMQVKLSPDHQILGESGPDVKTLPEGLEAIRGKFTEDAIIYFDSPSLVSRKAKAAKGYALALNQTFGLGPGQIFTFTSRTKVLPPLRHIFYPFWMKGSTLSQSTRFLTQTGLAGAVVLNVALLLTNHVMDAAFWDGTMWLAWELRNFNYNWGFRYIFDQDGKTKLRRARRGAMDQRFFANTAWPKRWCERLLTPF